MGVGVGVGVVDSERRTRTDAHAHAHAHAHGKEFSPPGWLRRLAVRARSQRMSAAEHAAAFLLARVRAARGRLWDEGARPAAAAAARDTALAVFATRRVRGVSPVVADSLLAWSRGERPADLVFEVLSPREVLRRQAAGRRCVALLEDEVALAHGDPRHPDGLSFALHDLHHLEKFVEPVHHLGQVGFFRAVDNALADTEVAALELTFDAIWCAERDYVLADMNGSAVFLFSVLKMRLAMAVRRRLASATGRPVPTDGASRQRRARSAASGLVDLVRGDGIAGGVAGRSFRGHGAA